MTSCCSQKLKERCVADASEARETEHGSQLLSCYPVSMAAIPQNSPRYNTAKLPGLTATVQSYYKVTPISEF